MIIIIMIIHDHHNHDHHPSFPWLCHPPLFSFQHLPSAGCTHKPVAFCYPFEFKFKLNHNHLDNHHCPHQQGPPFWRDSCHQTSLTCRSCPLPEIIWATRFSFLSFAWVDTFRFCSPARYLREHCTAFHEQSIFVLQSIGKVGQVHLISVDVKLQGWLHVHPRKMTSDKKEILGFDGKSI